MSKAILDVFINSTLKRAGSRFDLIVRRHLGKNNPHLIVLTIKDFEDTIVENFRYAMISTGKRQYPGDEEKLKKIAKECYKEYVKEYNRAPSIANNVDQQADYVGNTIQIYQPKYSERARNVFLKVSKEKLKKKFLRFSLKQQAKFASQTQFIHEGLGKSDSTQTVGTEQSKILRNVATGQKTSTGTGADSVKGLKDYISDAELDEAIDESITKSVGKIRLSTRDAREKGKEAIISMVKDIEFLWQKTEKNSLNIYKGEIVVRGKIGPSTKNRPGNNSLDWTLLRPRIEQALIAEFSASSNKYEDLGGSQTPKQKITSGVLDSVEKEIRSNLKNSKNVRVKVTSKSKKQEKSKTTTGKKPGKATTKKSTKSTVKIPIVKTKAKKPSSSTKKGEDPRSSLLKLQTLLNKKLPVQVRRNMGTPRLVNRTGRFSNSVEVKSITTSARGMPTINYTYQKYPYQTFEPGFAQGSRARDPKTLISKSIRDIATDILKERFNVRRI